MKLKLKMNLKIIFNMMLKFHNFALMFEVVKNLLIREINIWFEVDGGFDILNIDKLV